ncbi:unnamed protein product [Onchocerca ochengi]|uniref:Neuropeptide F n=2 Tax=Onchocerca TaxID=6281 RepID=A0A182DZW5_ONCOC|nr:unnamed protein product [Onchocerca ochengi]
MTTIYLFAGTLLLPALLVCNVPMDRAERLDKDLEQFTSAINGALRLRYGKRSYDSDVFGKTVRSQEVGDRYFEPSYDHFYLPIEEQKQLPLADRVIASLNGAERLRFG